jgi:hypothetical protein
MTTSAPPTSSFARRVYNPLGFTKAYNFILYFVFAGALLGFTLARLQYLNFNIFCPIVAGGQGAAPGECYYYRNFDWYRVGIYLHLGGVLPACLIAILQFTPFIRYKAILVHRIGGYTALLLYTVGTIGAFMIARRAFGGGLDVQAWIGTVGIGTMVCFVLAIVNIKRLQIEQHRAWMLRGWFYVCFPLHCSDSLLSHTDMTQAGSIITNRFILIIGTTTISSINSYYTSWPCAKIAFVMKSDARTLAAYPGCASYLDGTNPWQEAVVHADFKGEHATEIGAALNMNFGMALWVALIIHAVGVEIYVSRRC